MVKNAIFTKPLVQFKINVIEDTDNSPIPKKSFFFNRFFPVECDETIINSNTILLGVYLATVQSMSRCTI